jgi:hypothetical protein
LPAVKQFRAILKEKIKERKSQKKKLTQALFENATFRIPQTGLFEVRKTTPLKVSVWSTYI